MRWQPALQNRIHLPTENLLVTVQIEPVIKHAITAWYEHGSEKVLTEET